MNNNELTGFERYLLSEPEQGTRYRMLPTSVFASKHEAKIVKTFFWIQDILLLSTFALMVAVMSPLITIYESLKDSFSLCIIIISVAGILNYVLSVAKNVLIVKNALVADISVFLEEDGKKIKRRIARFKFYAVMGVLTIPAYIIIVLVYFNFIKELLPF